MIASSLIPKQKIEFYPICAASMVKMYRIHPLACTFNQLCGVCLNLSHVSPEVNVRLNPLQWSPLVYWCSPFAIDNSEVKVVCESLELFRLKESCSVAACNLATVHEQKLFLMSAWHVNCLGFLFHKEQPLTHVSWLVLSVLFTVHTMHEVVALPLHV